jgi:hypothetical protein
VAEGWKRSGVGGELPAEEALGAGGACAWREEKIGGERSGEARWWCSPFIGAEEGHAGARKGETTGGNGCNDIEGGAA